jgi:hypothetical protein
MFTDEEGQSYTDPVNDEGSMCRAVRNADVSMYTITKEMFFGDFDDCSRVFPLDQDPNVMVAYLQAIVEDACEQN